MPFPSTQTMLSVEDISAGDIDKTRDGIIIFMGQSGSGKSHLIDTLSRQPNRRSGNRFKGGRKTIQETRIRTRVGAQEYSLVLVDTPGLGRDVPDAEALKMIAEWMKNIYNDGILLLGIIYTHRITNTRVTSRTQDAHIRLLERICGDDFANRVIIATTMWDIVTSAIGYVAAERLESGLRNTNWKAMLQNGSHASRFTNSESSAWDLVRNLLDKPGSKTLLQQEMVDWNRTFKETSAAKFLKYQELSFPAAVRMMIPLKRLVSSLQSSNITSISSLLTSKGNIKERHDAKAERGSHLTVRHDHYDPPSISWTIHKGDSQDIEGNGTAVDQQLWQRQRSDGSDMGKDTLPAPGYSGQYGDGHDPESHSVAQLLIERRMGDGKDI
ncbi:hypothetical protein CVT24_005090 [Panaeolus cyanescens]|uniref:G domain-containing protein n=1 Tax=Panaeolus cyanescens TaxID=181874 RepID=A0A409W241_9AGAR|nr:hypothetical protein CVT24_005090 [Panaeolus cyanescens]